MKLNMTFTLTVETKRFKLGDKQDAGENVDLELTFDEAEAGLFLFRITECMFHYKDYRVLISFNKTTGEANGVSFSDDDYVYIVRSTQLFYMELIAGYEKIRLLEKMAAIAEASELQIRNESDDDKILDEFDDHIEVWE